MRHFVVLFIHLIAILLASFGYGDLGLLFLNLVDFKGIRKTGKPAMHRFGQKGLCQAIPSLLVIPVHPPR
jgi:hypothetical protein